MPEKNSIVIVGLGAMGGGYAAVLCRAGYRVAAIDIDRKAIDYALKHHLIHHGEVAAPAESSLSAQNVSALRALLGRADAVILGLYPEGILPWLRAYRQLLKPGVVMTDMAAVKGSFVAEAQALMPPGCEFIPSHPMAGMEKSGVWNADPARFANANFLITPTPQNTPAGISFAQRLGKLLGFGSMSILSVDEHDRLAGHACHLPHLLAVSLMLGADDHRLPNVAADSYLNLAKIVDINTGLWCDTFMANTPVLTTEILRFIDNLQLLRRRLANGDREGLRQLLEQSAENGRRFGAPPENGAG